MGNVVTAMAPAITMTIESTAAKIGRSMKNLDRADTSDLEQELMVREAASYNRRSSRVSDPRDCGRLRLAVKRIGFTDQWLSRPLRYRSELAGFLARRSVRRPEVVEIQIRRMP